ncbi:hypothetical protein RJ639_047429 [Escallonia herrerae]|uniref:AB hydrolase-1 domain-containing protein n=1 Tax=Escallonia herrerae TaxID=1293975 RepID=A0AA88W9Z1_9ASTE|nr:hypothetical protein RJ639_047429 [Escallonia herrerae]
MVKVFWLIRPLLHGLMKLVGMTPQLVEIEPGTVINIWVPSETITKNDKCKKASKPVVVLVHGFAADGIFTWLFQVLALSGTYSLYMPDLLFFGGSFTDKTERSSSFQAECLSKALRNLGVEKCTLVGLSYGGMIGFKMAKLHSDLVESLVVSSTVVELTESISRSSLENIGFSCWSDYLLPETVGGVKVLLSIGTHKLPWLPNFMFKDFLEVMFSNRKERAELLEALIISDKEAATTDYHQRIHMLWGDDDKIFNLQVAQKMKEDWGSKATFQYITTAGHLVQLERPCVYNRRLKKILLSLTILHNNDYGGLHDFI